MALSAEQRAFEAALKERLQERARTQLAGDQAVIKLLVDARQKIVELLAAQPSDVQRWQLSRLLQQIQDVLSAAMGDAGVAFDRSSLEAWQQGEDSVDKPLAAAGQAVELRLPVLDTQVLTAMRQFGQLRLKDVGSEAASKIGAQLGRATLGAITPFQAIQQVQQILTGPAATRATTIVRTELSRAYAVAGQQRLDQAADLLPDLQKQWRRSGKIHSRWNHDLMDGQVVAAKAKFTVPNPNGGADMMSGPHDPTAPAEQVINCGCVAIAHMKGWQVMTPGAKPFTKKELAQDSQKAMLDKAAKEVGRRQEGPT